jgi:osmotically-inducible protein OsmY
MFEPQTTPSRVDEWDRCRDGSSLSLEVDNRYDLANLENIGEYTGEPVGIEPEAADSRFEKLIHVGQKVFLPGDQTFGLITKLYLNPGGKISHLAIRTTRLFGRHKMVPIASVSDVTPLRVLLSINRHQFRELPGFHSDGLIAEGVDRALWKDIVLRDTDYGEIDVRVVDGIVTLNGHVITGMNQWRAETAAKSIPGVLGVKSYLVPDDRLTVEIAGALGQIEKREGCKFFTRVENGLAVLTGDVSSAALRDEAEQCVARIPWVRGIINDIHAPGIILDPEKQRFLQPLIGKELFFKDGLSVKIQKVVINPLNRCVIAVVALGQLPDPQRQDRDAGYGGDNSPKRQMVLPIGLITYLTPSAGFLRLDSREAAQFGDYDPSCYMAPDKGWLPPYPYCTAEVLFVAI